MIQYGLSWLARVWRPERRTAVADAYAALFGPQNALGQVVLADLGLFCHAGTPTVALDEPDRQGWINEGKRQAYLHVCELAALDPMALAAELRRSM